MGDELLEHYREHGRPQTHRVYAQAEDGTVTDETFAQMESLSDFEAGAFYVAPKKKQELITRWRTSRGCHP